MEDEHRLEAEAKDEVVMCCMWVSRRNPSESAMRAHAYVCAENGSIRE